jgi:hypothetical protein
MNSSDPAVFEQAGIAATQELTVEDIVQLQNLEQSSPFEEPLLRPGEALATRAELPAPQPIIPPKFPFRKISGRYLGSSETGFQLELRVDVDGLRPMKCVSGDVFQKTGDTTAYLGSFVANSPVVAIANNVVTIEGVANYSWTATQSKIRVSISRTLIIRPPAPARIQFLSLAGEVGLEQFLCRFVSPFFRTVQVETDHVDDVTAPLFQSYNTGSLPSGGAARTLSVASAYAEAGIEMVQIPPGPAVPAAGEGADRVWSDSELHASMVAQFSQWRDVTQWKVWELAAQLHELGPNLLGIMFDSHDHHQRQGCAVFYAGLAGKTPDKLRDQLYCYVHELGHCFNLLHSWQKPLAFPPQPGRPGALSWMNYPQMYAPGPGQPGGSGPFWNGFAFQFDDPELLHLRHGFRDSVIMGGLDFRIGAALEDPQIFKRPLTDNTGLKLEVSVAKQGNRFLFGEPIHIQARLSGIDPGGKLVHPHLNPSAGLLQIGICDPTGTVKSFRPLIEHCVSAEAVRMTVEAPLEESLYCGFGKDGFYFDRTGFYQVRAIYTALNGSKVFSNILNLRVAHPVTHEDEEVADLFFGQDQGTLFYLHGSDSESLQHGNDALNKVLEEHSNHPLAEYVRMIHGINERRTFKTLTPEKMVSLRKAKPDRSSNLLSIVVDNADKGKSPIDPLILRELVLPNLARAQEGVGDVTAAAKTAERIKAKKTKAAKAA